MYYPFFKVYDRELVLEEAERAKHEFDGELEEKATLKVEQKPTPKVKIESKTDKKQLVLVLCASGATSSMLANAITKGAKQEGVNVESIAMAYGQHKDVIADYDLIILAPQMASMYEELKADCASKGTKSATTTGKEYVKLTRDPVGALKFALDIINE